MLKTIIRKIYLFLKEVRNHVVEFSYQKKNQLFIHENFFFILLFVSQGELNQNLPGTLDCEYFMYVFEIYHCNDKLHQTN